VIILNNKEWIEQDLMVLKQLKMALDSFISRTSETFSFIHDDTQFTWSLHYYYTDEMYTDERKNAFDTILKLKNDALLELNELIEALESRKEEMDKKTYAVIFTYQDISVSIKSGFKTHAEAVQYIWGLDDDSKQFLSVV
jgi:hypothetical protein